MPRGWQSHPSPNTSIYCNPRTKSRAPGDGRRAPPREPVTPAAAARHDAVGMSANQSDETDDRTDHLRGQSPACAPTRKNTNDDTASLQQLPIPRAARELNLREIETPPLTANSNIPTPHLAAGNLVERERNTKQNIEP